MEEGKRKLGNAQHNFSVWVWGTLTDNELCQKLVVGFGRWKGVENFEDAELKRTHQRVLYRIFQKEKKEQLM